MIKLYDISCATLYILISRNINIDFFKKETNVAVFLCKETQKSRKWWNNTIVFLLALYSFLLFFPSLILSSPLTFYLTFFFSYFSTSCQFPFPADVGRETLIVTSRPLQGLSSSLADSNGQKAVSSQTTTALMQTSCITRSIKSVISDFHRGL